jgi:hypothetical protein
MPRPGGWDLPVKGGIVKHKSDMEFIGKIGDPLESDGALCPDLREVRSDFPEAFGQL